MKYYLVCNWKMNPSSFDKAKDLILNYNKLFRSKRGKKNNDTQIILCPPYVYFQLLDEKRSKNIKLGAQDIFWEGAGPYTGQISAKMVREFGAEYVLVGHSELRRVGNNEEIINVKIREALRKHIIPIVCVGYSDHIKETKSIISNFSAEEVNRIIFAYEPVEAVDTLNPASFEKVSKSVREIKKIIFGRFKRKNFWGLINIGGKKRLIPRPAILYGGSVNPSNCEQYLYNADISGFVIGRESLKPENIKKIAEKMEKY